MGFSRGAQSTESGERKLYTGVGSFFVKGLNLNKKELGEIFGSERDEEPKYLGERTIEGVGTFPQARIDIVIATDPDKCGGIEKTFIVPFFVTKRIIKGSQSGKTQIIDKYGRTQWVTDEELASHAIPVSSKTGLPLNIDADYRPIYDGEENLTNFFKAFLNVPEVDKWKDGKIVGQIDNPADAEARIPDMDALFKGDFSMLKEFLTYQPNNKFKLLLGVRTTDDNKQYQAFFTEMPMKNGINNFDRLEKTLIERKANGAYSTTEFEVCELKEFTNTPSSIPAAPTTGAAPANPWFKK